MAERQIIKVEFNNKPGKIRITIRGIDEVACRIHYLRLLEQADDSRWIFRMYYVDRIDPVTNDETCYMCDEQEKYMKKLP